MVEDWGLIEASFQTQYNIRLRDTDLDWGEFSNMLSGIMPKTPLGQIISIRSEDDADILKNFTVEQKKIRQEWRSKQSKLMSDKELDRMMKELENMFKNAFS